MWRKHWHCHSFFGLSFLIVFSSCRNNSEKLNHELHQLDSAQSSINSDTVAGDLISDLFSKEIDTNYLRDCLNQGGSFNSFIQFTHEYEYNKLGSNIPIIRDFINDPTKQQQEDFHFSPLHALLISTQKQKMELLLFMLKNGADPNLISPENKNAFDYLYSKMANGSSNVLVELETSMKSTNIPIDPFSPIYIDTLVAYGADIKKSNLKYLNTNLFMINYAINLGADSKTIDVTQFFGVPVRLIDNEELITLSKNGLDFYNLKGDKICFISQDTSELSLLNKCGFDFNQPISDGYMLDHAILSGKLFLVEYIVRNGGHTVSGQKKPIDFAKDNEATQEIINFLKSNN